MNYQTKLFSFARFKIYLNHTLILISCQNNIGYLFPFYKDGFFRLWIAVNMYSFIIHNEITVSDQSKN